MIVFYGIIAVFIAWIWVDYYRLIDIYENEKLKYFILTFILGCSSVFVVLGLNEYVLNGFHFTLNGDLLNDILYCVFKVGLIEELVKLLPFVVMYFLFKKQFNEPIDYLAFISISALGFSAAENFIYFQNYGPDIINGRAILSTVGHMFDAALIAYGIIRFKYHPQSKGIIEIFVFFFLAVISHAFYDFWLMFEGTKSWGWIVTVLYFLVTISLFAVILNNALNNSSFFSYKKVIDSNKVVWRLLAYYGIVFLMQFVSLIVTENLRYALLDLKSSIYTSGIVAGITCIRLSRFKLVQGRWQKLKVELPFTFRRGDPFDTHSRLLKLGVKGESYNEVYINRYYQEYFLLYPVSKRKTLLGSSQVAYIDRKLFLENGDTYFVTKLFHGSDPVEHEMVLLKPKMSGATMVSDKYPIVALLRIKDLADLENPKSGIESFTFQEWAYPVPLPAEEKVPDDQQQ